MQEFKVYSKEEIAPIAAAIDKRDNAIAALKLDEMSQIDLQDNRWKRIAGGLPDGEVFDHDRTKRGDGFTGTPEHPVQEIRLAVGERLRHGERLGDVAEDVKFAVSAYEFHLVNYALGELESGLGSRRIAGGLEENFTSREALRNSLEKAEKGLSGKLLNLAQEDVKDAIDAKIAELQKQQTHKPAVRGHQSRAASSAESGVAGYIGPEGARRR